MRNTIPIPEAAPPTRRRRLLAVCVAAVAAVAIGFGARALETSDPDTPIQTAQHSETAARLESVLAPLLEAGYPAVLASVTGPDGEQVDVAIGRGDLATGQAPPVDGEVRIASNTKMFVAVIVLQLVQEGLVELDSPIETYLPGLITGEGIDGAAITVRQLLQHTSGLPEYADQIAADAFGARDSYVAPRDVLDVALARPAVFEPGGRWEYSNTNYLILGLLIERVTQRPLGEHVQERIAAPLALEHTYLPAAGERTIRGEHPHGYHSADATELADITVMDPSFAWSAGAVVSTPSELNAFMQAALDGTLLTEASVAELQDAVPAGDALWPEATYGLGWQSYPLSCGGVAWGHGGDIPGTQTRNAVGPDGTAVTIAVTALPWAIVDPADEERLLDHYRIVVDALDTVLCQF